MRQGVFRGDFIPLEQDQGFHTPGHLLGAASHRHAMMLQVPSQAGVPVGMGGTRTIPGKGSR